MVYYGTDVVEYIVFHTAGNSEDKHLIGMAKSADSQTFTVDCCCDSEWRYSFRMENNSDYERIKFNIMQTVFECETMEELLSKLSELFKDGFEELLIKDECDGNCDCYDCK